jgi:hypothetical protein
VQNGGLPGLYVLAHGAPSRLRSWLPLGRLLDDARPHFTRVVLALDPNIARQAGESLAGRLVDGWWAGGDAHKARDARRFSARLGIPLQQAEPVGSDDATVEVLVSELARGRDAAPAAPIAPATAVPVAAVAAAPAEPAPDAAIEPARDLSPLERLVEELMRDAARASAAEPELEAFDQMVEELGGDGTVARAPSGSENSIVAAMGHEVEPAREDPAPAEAGVAAIEATAAEPGAAPALAPAPEPALATGSAPATESDPTLAIEALAAARGLAPAPALEGAHAPSELMPAPDAPALAGAGPAAQDALDDSVVLECDPEVRERLRFLIWMRKLREKTRDDVAHAR